MQSNDIARNLDILNASMKALKTSIETAEGEYKMALCRESTTSVQVFFASLKYTTETTAAIVCSGPSFESFTTPGRTYDIGCATIPKNICDSARICNLSEYMQGVFSAPGDNVFEQTKHFLANKWTELCTYDMYTLPINLEAQRAGKKKCDLPNVNFAFCLLYHQMVFDHDLVVCDPLTMRNPTEGNVRITNYSHVYRELQKKRVRVQTFKNKCGDPSKGLDVILYQRGTGDPDYHSLRAIATATGLGPEHIMHMNLVPGKESVGLMGGNCYRDFASSVALILHELSFLDEYSRKRDKSFINDVKFVLDPFSGYAAFTAVAVLGYGIEDMVHVLAGRYKKGVLTYTSVP
tara:strand:- start:10835 stop:11881 length:1047 start_codon:yes stop_codon:yes gene_type:complete